jgi:hypothetical protein
MRQAAFEDGPLQRPRDTGLGKLVAVSSTRFCLVKLSMMSKTRKRRQAAVKSLAKWRDHSWLGAVSIGTQLDFGCT